MRIPKTTKVILCDLDGTIYLSDTPIKGAVEAVERMRKKSRVLFLTNNSSVTASHYIKKLASMGITARRDDIVTSGDVAADFIKRNFPRAKLFILGTHDFSAEFSSFGLSQSDDPDTVLVAFDTELTYAKLEYACDLIRNGARYIATHCDLNCPKEGGFKPDVGSFIALIEKSTGRKPDFICGKPDKIMAEYIQNHTKARADETMMIGDRLYTDMKFAWDSGFVSCLVLSGETTAQEAKKATVDFTIGSVAELE